jgi:hypothetical protein
MKEKFIKIWIPSNLENNDQRHTPQGTLSGFAIHLVFLEVILWYELRTTLRYEHSSRFATGTILKNRLHTKRLMLISRTL